MANLKGFTFVSGELASELQTMTTSKRLSTSTQHTKPRGRTGTRAFKGGGTIAFRWWKTFKTATENG